MTNEPENPLAFPQCTTTHVTGGMTLRDYFAAAALKGIVSGADTFWVGAAPLAYELADAMLAAREQTRKAGE